MASGGGKRKIGHNKKRSISMQSYVATGRLLTNKKRRVGVEEKRQALCGQAVKAFAQHCKLEFPFKMKDVSRAVRMYKRGEFNGSVYDNL